MIIKLMRFNFNSATRIFGILGILRSLTSTSIAILVSVFFLVPMAHALVHELPSNIATLVLSESVPSLTITPGHFQAEDFSFEWMGEPLPGARLRVGEKSIEWIRVAKVLVLPRGRAMIEIENIDAGQVTNQGFTQSFVVQNNKGTAEIPIAMVSGEKNPIQIRVRRGGDIIQRTAILKFTPRKENRAHIFSDTTCSPFKLSAENISIPDNSWVYIGCRLIYSEGDQHRTSSLEVFVFWDGVGQKIEIDHIETPASSVSIWPLRLRSSPGVTTLSSGMHQFDLVYRVPEYLHYGMLGMGIGPYSYSFTSLDQNTNSISPILTFYGSYFIHEALKIALFNATSVHLNWNTDTGVYAVAENLRTWDERLSFNLLVGARIVLFATKGSLIGSLSAPQGFEFVFRDFILRRYNFALGTFAFPKIAGTSYYNLWLRWGPPEIFGEFNYVSWSNSFNGQDVSSQSFGFTVGFPLTNFL